MFLLYRKMNRLYIYIFPLSFGLPSHSSYHSALRKVACTIQCILISYMYILNFCLSVLFLAVLGLCCCPVVSL